MRRLGCELLLMLVSLVFGGCSFTSVTPVQSPEKEAVRERVQHDEPLEGVVSQCTSSRALPVLDTVFGGIVGITATSVAVSPKETFDGLPGGQLGLTLTAVGVTLLSFASAGYGFERTSACIDFKRKVHQKDSPDDEDSGDRSEVEKLRERVRRLEQER
jgi:hypothetical protein